MKAIAGIDVEGSYEPALRLLAKCRFRDLDLTLLNAVPEVGWMDIPVEEIVRREDAEGAQALQRAANLAANLGLTAETRQTRGGAGQALLEAADEVDADLLVVQSQRKGVLRSFFLGSTSRALALGAKQSILIGKRESIPSRPLTAVFATDHSEYCRSALELFLALAPEGIERIHVLSAVCLDELEFRAGHLETVFATTEIKREIQGRLEGLNGDVAAKLSQAGYSVSSSAPVNFLAEAVNESIDANEADLLIMGSQGHGFLERVTLGSSALHQVVSEEHNLLLLRPR